MRGVQGTFGASKRHFRLGLSAATPISPIARRNQPGAPVQVLAGCAPSRRGGSRTELVRPRTGDDWQGPWRGLGV